MSRHQVQLAPDITFIVGHCDDSNIEVSPVGTSFAGPLYASMFIGESADLSGKPDAQALMLRDPDDVLDWVEKELSEIGRMPSTGDVWEGWVGKISMPLVMEGKDGPLIRAFFGQDHPNEGEDLPF